MFCSLLKEMRSQKSLTQAQLAKTVGVSPGNVGDWETGKSKPGYNALAALARIFEVSADYLLELTPEKTGKTEDELRHLDEIKKEQGLTCDGSPLDNVEADLVAMFRLLSEEEREDVFDIVHLKYKRRLNCKRESIYWTYFDESEGEQSGPAEGRETRDGTT